MKQLMIGCLALTACGTYEENLGRTRDASARWAAAVATPQHERARGVAIDSNGDVVAVGDQYTGNPLQYAGFVSKRVASDGSERWMTKFMPLTPDYSSSSGVQAVGIGPEESVLVGGGFQGRVDFAGTTLDATVPATSTGGAGFLAKLSSAGQVQWVRMLDNVGVKAIAMDHTGRSYITGRFMGPLTLGGMTLSSSSADSGAILIALDSGGAPLWGRVFIATPTNDGSAFGESITIAPNGDVLVVGQFYSATSFGGPVLSLPAGSRAGAFVTRFRSDGLYLASTVVPAPGWDVNIGVGVAVDPAGATVVSTEKQNPAEGKNSVSAVHVLDDAQNELWTTQVHGPIAFTSDGAILTAQWVDDRPHLVGALELATVDSSGFTWATSLGERIVNAPRYSKLWAAAAGPDGGMALVGELTGTINIADTELAAVGGQQDDSDALVIMIDP